MNQTTLSPKFQIMIPKDVRAILKLKAGVKFTVIPYGERIELVPVKPLKSLRGCLKGKITDFVREKDREI